ncbi:MAG: hypothetical protein PHZ07_01600 [Patescibacteria group bacterium]|nr:hypothetical protein [Patescibacteria group bacterium]MDD4303871.1 hypothetical protein [Patescibacteria group bacterium]MDD4695142.1 hypothetical protein [Patescibacteria group bacterium]
MEEHKEKLVKFSPFYYIFKVIISIFGVFSGIIFVLTIFYPLILSFPSNVIIIFLEIYLLIVFSIVFKKIFLSCFNNYINYKPIFFNVILKNIFPKGIFMLSFYIFGLIIFFFFIAGMF